MLSTPRELSGSLRLQWVELEHSDHDAPQQPPMAAESTLKTLLNTFKANPDLHKALHQAKRTWAHKQLHHTIEDCDIWSLAKTHNGQQVHTFLPLKAADSTLVNNLTLKADIFKARFPTAPLPVDDIQPSNPPAHNT